MNASASERLFEREMALREAANAYANRNPGSRQRLRAAALAYADLAHEIDEKFPAPPPEVQP